MKYIILIILSLCGCGKDNPFFSGYLNRVHDAALVSCDPYNLKEGHSCLVIANAYASSLYVYDATVGELVLAPNNHFPLKIKTSAHQLIPIKADKDPKILLALESEYLRAIRLMGDEHKPSFSEPEKYPLDDAILSMAAALFADKIIALAIVKQEVKVMMLDPENGAIDKTLSRSIKIGKKPRHIVIDDHRTKAMLIDDEDAALYSIDLANIIDVINNTASPIITNIALSHPQHKIVASHYTKSNKLYALTSSGKDITIIDVGNNTHASLALDEEISALYLPSDGHNPYEGHEHWAMAVSVKGSWYYFAINDDPSLALTKIKSIDLTKEENLSVNSIMIHKIIGGAIIKDSSINKKPLCDNYRQVFFLSAFASQRINNKTPSEEIEGSSLACEGSDIISRFGILR